MAWCPFAVKQAIPETYSQGLITPTTIISHEAVSWADSLYGYWTSGGVELESHFYVGRWGVIYQYMDTIRRADANCDANDFAISIETWDNGGDVNGWWYPEQMTALKRLHLWLCQVHPSIPRRAASTWNGGGIGGHNWFPYPWARGPRGCPGGNRSTQIRNEIIPFVQTNGGAVPPPPPPPPPPAPSGAGPFPLPRNEWFGDIRGPAASHGGAYAWERPHIKRIQQALQRKGFAPNYPGWADGLFEQETVISLAAWQRRWIPGTTLFGQCWWDDWAALLA